MRRLLDDWARVSAEWARTQAAGPVPLGRPEDPNRLLLTVLTGLINDYPGTHIKPSTAPWDAIRDNLIKARTLCGLSPAGGLSPGARNRATAEEQAEIIRTDAFITLFLAHSRRFRDPADPSAQRFYDDARRAFRELGDEWTSAWLVYECSDLALERCDLKHSAELVAEGATLARELSARTFEWDRELLANLHRTWADVCWRSDRLAESARHYGWAVAHAYWFQGEPDAADGDPHGPDEYTQQFYVEMTLRAAERIAELAEYRPEQMEQFASEMQVEVPRDAGQVPATGFAGATIADLRERLFPAGPASSNELRWVDTPFMERWRALYLERKDPLAGLDELARASLAVAATQ
jgi:hypothetical protein